MFANTNTPKHKFQSTLSMRRATTYCSRWPEGTAISIHALHEESDARPTIVRQSSARFQSTLSMRRATDKLASMADAMSFQSTLSMRRATGGYILCMT